MFNLNDDTNPFLILLKEIILNIQLPAALFNDNKKPIFSNDLYDNYLQVENEMVFQLKDNLQKKGIKIHPLETDNNLYGYLLIADRNPLLESEQKIFAHDLNNYLSNALNSFDLLQQNAALKHLRENMIESVGINLRKAIELAVQFLSPESGIKIKAIINPAYLVNDAVKSFDCTLPERIQIKTYIDESTKKIIGNFTDLNRVLINLLSNAKEAILDEGKISIRTGNTTTQISEGHGLEDYIFISVKDTGSGIEQENLDKIFTEDFSTKDKGRISGLGLAAVKKIITAHKGFLEVNSKINEGSEFIVYLPAVQPSEKHEAKSGTKTKTILIGEDETELQEVLAEMFKSYDYNIISAANGTELINIVAGTNEIDLFIIDKNIPGIDGINCIKILRKMGFVQPIILATGSYFEQEKKEFKEMNISRVINKPYLFEDLLKEVEELFTL